MDWSNGDKLAKIGVKLHRMLATFSIGHEQGSGGYNYWKFRVTSGGGTDKPFWRLGAWLSITPPTYEGDLCGDDGDGCDLAKMCGAGSRRLQEDGSCVIDVHLPGRSVYYVTLFGVTLASDPNPPLVSLTWKPPFTCSQKVGCENLMDTEGCHSVPSNEMEWQDVAKGEWCDLECVNPYAATVTRVTAERKPFCMAPDSFPGGDDKKGLRECFPDATKKFTDDCEGFHDISADDDVERSDAVYMARLATKATGKDQISVGAKGTCIVRTKGTGGYTQSLSAGQIVYLPFEEGNCMDDTPEAIQPTSEQEQEAEAETDAEATLHINATSSVMPDESLPSQPAASRRRRLLSLKEAANNKCKGTSFNAAPYAVPGAAGLADVYLIRGDADRNIDVPGAVNTAARYQGINDIQYVYTKPAHTGLYAIELGRPAGVGLKTPVVTVALPEVVGGPKAAVRGNAGTVGMWLRKSNRAIKPEGEALFSWIPSGVFTGGCKEQCEGTRGKSMMSVILEADGSLKLYAVSGGGTYGVVGIDTCTAKSPPVKQLLNGAWHYVAVTIDSAASTDAGTEAVIVFYVDGAHSQVVIKCTHDDGKNWDQKASSSSNKASSLGLHNRFKAMDKSISTSMMADDASVGFFFRDKKAHFESRRVLLIGAALDAGEGALLNPLSAAVDTLAAYDRALSADEVATLGLDTVCASRFAGDGYAFFTGSKERMTSPAAANGCTSGGLHTVRVSYFHSPGEDVVRELGVGQKPSDAHGEDASTAKVSLRGGEDTPDRWSLSDPVVMSFAEAESVGPKLSLFTTKAGSSLGAAAARRRRLLLAAEEDPEDEEDSDSSKTAMTHPVAPWDAMTHRRRRLLTTRDEDETLVDIANDQASMSKMDFLENSIGKMAPKPPPPAIGADGGVPYIRMAGKEVFLEWFGNMGQEKKKFPNPPPPSPPPPPPPPSPPPMTSEEEEAAYEAGLFTQHSYFDKFDYTKTHVYPYQCEGYGSQNTGYTKYGHVRRGFKILADMHSSNFRQTAVSDLNCMAEYDEKPCGIFSEENPPVTCIDKSRDSPYYRSFPRVYEDRRSTLSKRGDFWEFYNAVLGSGANTPQYWRIAGDAGYALLTEQEAMKNLTDIETGQKYQINSGRSCGVRYPGRVRRYHDDKYLTPGGSSEFTICYARESGVSQVEDYDNNDGAATEDTISEETNKCMFKDTGKVHHCKGYFVYELKPMQTTSYRKQHFNSPGKDIRSLHLKIASVDFRDGMEDPPVLKKEEDDYWKVTKEEFKAVMENAGATRPSRSRRASGEILEATGM